jgi:hypothetical protein
MASALPTKEDFIAVATMSKAGVASAAGVSAYILYLAKPTTDAWYPWHPACMAAGTLFLMTLAIHFMRPGSTMPYRQKVRGGREREGEGEGKRRNKREGKKKKGSEKMEA